MKKGPYVGLALGGGFLRGAAHAGVLKVLVEEGIPIHVVAGSSSGSLAAALFACGYTPQQIKDFALGLRPGNVFDGLEAVYNMFLLAIKKIADLLGLSLPLRVPLGLMSGKRLERNINQGLGSGLMFSDLTTACLVVTAVDVTTGSMILFMPEQTEFLLHTAGPVTIIPPVDKIIINDVPVAAAVRASCSVPGLYEPKPLRGHVLVDGGVRNNIPADVLKKMGLDVVISVDVGYDGYSSHRVTSITEVLLQSLDIMASESMLIKLKETAGIVIRPEIRDVSVWDFDKLYYCYEQGENKAREMLPVIHKAIFDKQD